MIFLRLFIVIDRLTLFSLNVLTFLALIISPIIAAVVFFTVLSARTHLGPGRPPGLFVFDWKCGRRLFSKTADEAENNTILLPCLHGERGRGFSGE